MIRPIPSQLFCALAILVVPTEVGLGAIITVSETVADFGTLNQRAMTNACDSNPLYSCGPTATANSLLFLQNTYPNVYDTRLVPNGAGQPQATVNTLGMFMDCGCAGESTAQMLQGKMAYIQGGPDATGTNRTGVAPNTTVFDSQFLSDFTGTGKGTVPTLAFMLQELRAKEDVEMVIGLYTLSGTTYTRTGGHVVTLTGVSYDDTNNAPRNVSFIDPLGTTTNLNGALTINGANLTTVATQYGNLLDISNYFASVNNPLWNPRTDANTFALIDGLVAESPVPEPTAIVLFALGIAMLCLTRVHTRNWSRLYRWSSGGIAHCDGNLARGKLIVCSRG